MTETVLKHRVGPLDAVPRGECRVQTYPASVDAEGAIVVEVGQD